MSQGPRIRAKPRHLQDYELPESEDSLESNNQTDYDSSTLQFQIVAISIVLTIFLLDYSIESSDEGAAARERREANEGSYFCFSHLRFRFQPTNFPFQTQHYEEFRQIRWKSTMLAS